MAIRGIDHIVADDDDVDTLTASHRAAGFTVTPGGRHPWGTHNALVPLDDGSYIELLSFWKDDHDAHRRHSLLQKGGGLIEFMLTSDDIESDILAVNGRGAGYANPVPGSRVRPDGIKVGWIDGPARDDAAGVPSLIQGVTDRKLRVPDGRARQHENGVEGLDRLLLVVADLDRQLADTRRCWAAYLSRVGQTDRPRFRSGLIILNFINCQPTAQCQNTSLRSATAHMRRYATEIDRFLSRTVPAAQNFVEQVKSAVIRPIRKNNVSP